MNITKQLVADQSRRTYDGTNPCNYLTIHQTGNPSAGANAQAHANLQSRGNVRVASWQYTVDDHSVFQSYDDESKCWHAGDGLGKGNTESIGIELCINSDGDYAKTLDNAVWLVRVLMKRHGIPLARVVQHNRWSSYGKNCPAQLRGGVGGIDWADFIADVAASSAVSNPVTAPADTASNAQEGDIMASLPTLDWRQQNHSYDAEDARVQGLLAADGTYKDRIDGLRGPNSVNALRATQIAHNSGDGKGRADMFIGSKTWRALLFGSKF